MVKLTECTEPQVRVGKAAEVQSDRRLPDPQAQAMEPLRFMIANIMKLDAEREFARRHNESGE